MADNAKELVNDAFSKSVETVFSETHSSPKGIAESELEERRSQGRNVLEEEEAESLIMGFLGQFTEPMILLLLASATISLMLGQQDDAISITVAVLIVSVVGFVQEYNSEKALEALKEYVTHTCVVTRRDASGNSVTSRVSAEDLVVGDVVSISIGDRVPADLRLFEASSVKADEALLTGEARQVNKDTSVQQTDPNTPPAKVNNMLFMGTTVVSGNARGVVVSVGTGSELGKIWDMIKEVQSGRTPLQQKMDQLGKQLSLFSFGVIAVIFVIGFLQGQSLLVMFTVGVSLAVAAIPEGLPIVVTVTLALGVSRMAQRKALVRKLPAVEALGSATVICVDKTGTLTQNQMTVREVFTSELITVTGVGYTTGGSFLRNNAPIDPTGDKDLIELLRAGMLCNNARIENGKLFGQPTEGALLAAARKAGLKDEREMLKRIEEIPFDTEHKWMATFYNTSNGPMCFVKGTAERILERATIYNHGDHQAQFLPAQKQSVMKVAAQMASKSLRVMALARGVEVHPSTDMKAVKGLAFLGLVGIADPPRDGVKESIAEAQGAGVQVVMLTGDSKETAIAIGRELGIYNDDPKGAMACDQLINMSPDQLARAVKDVSVFYRMTPGQKMKIVDAYKQNGEVVAMTGDGVNDAPALKSAAIGIAMGGGQDVSKEASEMILVDDNFSTIIAAIEEGRSIYNNIRNFLRFQLTTSIAALSIIASCTLFDLPLPLNPMQILWINIIMDGPPAQSLGVEPLDKEVMTKPPRNPKDPVVSARMIFNIITGAGLMILGTVFVFMWGLDNARGDGDNDTAMTMAFTTFVLFQMFNAVNCRSESKSTFAIPFFQNRFFLVSVGLSIAMQLAVVYIPTLQYFFDTEALTLHQFLLCTGVASSVWVFDELKKLLTRK